MQKLSVIFHKIYQEPTEIRVAEVKNCHTVLPINVTIVIHFLQGQTNTSDMWNIAPVFQVLFTISITKIS